MTISFPEASKHLKKVKNKFETTSTSLLLSPRSLSLSLIVLVKGKRIEEWSCRGNAVDSLSLSPWTNGEKRNVESDSNQCWKQDRVVELMYESRNSTDGHNSQLSFYEYPSHKPYINSVRQPLRPSFALSRTVSLPESNRDELLQSFQTLAVKIKNLETEREVRENRLISLSGRWPSNLLACRRKFSSANQRSVSIVRCSTSFATGDHRRTAGRSRDELSTPSRSTSTRRSTARQRSTTSNGQTTPRSKEETCESKSGHHSEQSFRRQTLPIGCEWHSLHSRFIHHAESQRQNQCTESESRFAHSHARMKIFD